MTYRTGVIDQNVSCIFWKKNVCSILGLFSGGEAGRVGVHPFFNFKGEKGLKVSIWSMMEGSKKNLGFH